MNAPRYIIEGTWSGYTSTQRRVCHRTVHKGAEKSLRAWAEKTYAIAYSDGTSLIIKVRDCEPREHVEEIRGYGELIRDCAHHDVSSVDALCAIEDEIKQRRVA
ncbi:conserved protein of unknown function [Pararobbsia alpina]|uniref:hypothetical protein n=1 Tax=Pararobbsia alpina TaxID=621374 RepID=UPI0039A6DB89